jgi:hypothetical protein
LEAKNLKRPGPDAGCSAIEEEEKEEEIRRKIKKKKKKKKKCRKFLDSLSSRRIMLHLIRYLSQVIFIERRL